MLREHFRKGFSCPIKQCTVRANLIHLLTLQLVMEEELPTLQSQVETSKTSPISVS